jgi:hypothetical protein
MVPDIEAHQIMSRSSDVFSTEAGGDVALMSVPNGRYYALNAVASDIWRNLEKPARVGDLTATLCAKYSGDPSQIERDLEETLQDWLAWRLIEVTPASHS